MTLYTAPKKSNEQIHMCEYRNNYKYRFVVQIFIIYFIKFVKRNVFYTHNSMSEPTFAVTSHFNSMRFEYKFVLGFIEILFLFLAIFFSFVCFACVCVFFSVLFIFLFASFVDQIILFDYQDLRVISNIFLVDKFRTADIAVFAICNLQFAICNHLFLFGRCFIIIH